MWGAGRAGGLGRGRGCGRGSREQLSGFLQRPPPPPQFPRTRKDCAPGQGWGELGSSLLLQDGGQPHSSPVFFLQPCMHLTSLGRPRLLALETSLPSLWVTREYRQVMTSQGAVCLLWAPEYWGLQEEGSLAFGASGLSPCPSALPMAHVQWGSHWTSTPFHPTAREFRAWGSSELQRPLRKLLPVLGERRPCLSRVSGGGHTCTHTQCVCLYPKAARDSSYTPVSPSIP